MHQDVGAIPWRFPACRQGVLSPAQLVYFGLLHLGGFYLKRCIKCIMIHVYDRTTSTTQAISFRIATERKFSKQRGKSTQKSSFIIRGWTTSRRKSKKLISSTVSGSESSSCSGECQGYGSHYSNWWMRRSGTQHDHIRVRK